MHQSQMHYLPLAPGYFSALVVAFIMLLLLIQLGPCATRIFGSE